MLKYYGIVRETARKLNDAINHTILAYANERLEQEPAFTDRMLGSIEEALHEFQTKGLKWQAKTLTDRGPHAQEKKYGADFMGVLNVDLPGYRVSKGFLAQAKITDSWLLDFRELYSQCKKMLSFSSASFVFLYNKQSVKVVPAISVVGSGDPTILYSYSALKFFEQHFKSFIGDHNISAPNIDTLEELRMRYEARSLLFLRAGTILM